MQNVAYRTAAILWVVWGLVHMFAGVIIISSDASGAAAAVADAVDPQLLAMDYHPAVGALLNQHGWNLGWIGLTTVLCAPFVWRGNIYGIALAALVGGLADIGYFLFMDLGGFVNFVPGTVMTFVSGGAILLSFGAYFGMTRSVG